ncbi:hypothetical protein AVEN_135381-1 [Araneus ventricosus]|uniref:Uncharacterized protein n=1 Tax=Araneus ventricosus TaxID=182803 RepID=A0A4Y2N258_ARAVE|nr:hypothetical protein AVEN_135381-1 [Araneus ventricosus]
MDFFLFLAVFLQLLFCSLDVAVALFGESFDILPILGCCILGVLFEYGLTLMTPATVEETSGVGIESCSMKQSTIPGAKSKAVWLGQALDLNAELAVEGGGTKRKQVPTVRSATVWSYCRRLRLPAKLEFPYHTGILMNADDIPTVHFRDVYLLCEALKLKAKLAQ